jgi:predicted CoA-binding protein
MTQERAPGRHLATLEDVEPLLRRRLTVAVLGAHDDAHRPAFYVPAWLVERGHRVLPVNPRLVGKTIFGQPVRAQLAELDGAVDVVDVFRRSDDIPAHVDDILAMRQRPGVVWLQSGIDHPEVCARLRDAGIDTVADRCMLADGRALGL